VFASVCECASVCGFVCQCLAHSSQKIWEKSEQRDAEKV